MKNLNKITLFLRVSLGTLTVVPLVSNALMVINDANIANYTTTGILANTDDYLIQTTSATAPHINMITNNDAVVAKSGKTITIGNNSSADKFTIQTNSTGNYASATAISSLYSGKIISNSELELNVKDGTGIYLASQGDGLFKQKVTINGTGTSVKSFIGIRLYNNSTIANTTGTFNKEVFITSSGKSSYGIFSDKNINPRAMGTDLTFNEKVNINMTGIDGHGVVFSRQGNSGNPNVQSIIDFRNGLDAITQHGNPISMNQINSQLNVNSGANVNNIISIDNQTYNAIQAFNGTVNVNGKSNIEGDIFATSSGTHKGIINLVVTNGSTILSSMSNYPPPDLSLKGDINLTISGNQSQWKMTNNSMIDSLTVNDNAKISFGYNYATPNSVTGLDNTNAMTLTTNSLDGKGLFEIRTAIGNNIANDLLKVTGSQQAKGNHKLVINDNLTGSAMVTGTEKITLVETEGGGANFALSVPSVDIGPYEFNQLTQVNNVRGSGSEDWVLSASSNNNNNNNGNNDNNKDTGNTKPKLTHTAQNAVNILNSNYLMNYVETQTLLQRMGQLRKNGTTGGDAWGRIYTGKLSSFNDSRLSNFDMNYYGLQLGIDRKLENDNQDIYFGIMGAMSRGNIDHNVGDGNTKSYSLGMYTTLLNQSGFYVDGLVKYMHMSNKFNSRTGGGYNVKGDGDTKGFSIGAEIGQRIYLSSTSANQQGWYLEPQAQLTYSHQNGATIKATNGLKTKLGSYNSLIARASSILGYSIQENENPIDIYFKTGYLKEFDGETDYKFNHVAKEKYDFGGNWWDNGVGINMQINQNHNLYGDIVYSLGNKFDQKQINLGYRFNF